MIIADDNPVYEMDEIPLTVEEWEEIIRKAKELTQHEQQKPRVISSKRPPDQWELP